MRICVCILANSQVPALFRQVEIRVSNDKGRLIQILLCKIATRFKRPVAIGELRRFRYRLP